MSFQCGVEVLCSPVGFVNVVECTIIADTCVCLYATHSFDIA